MKFDNVHQKMDRKQAYAVDEVLPFIAQNKDSENVKRDYDGDIIKMFSDRYKVFNKSTVCECGIQGTFFVKERDISAAARNEPYHFNLYGVDSDGQAVLMTKDHIIPKSKGGKNSLSNYVTMCYPCNQIKGARS